jgi:hypothetical protein
LLLGDLFAAASALCREQLSQQVLGFDPARPFGIQLCDQIEHHPAQHVCVLRQLMGINRHCLQRRENERKAPGRKCRIY